MHKKAIVQNDPTEPDLGRAKLLTAAAIIGEALGHLAGLSINEPRHRVAREEPQSLTARLLLPNVPGKFAPALILAFPGKAPTEDGTIVLVVNHERRAKLAEWRRDGQSFVDLTGKVFIAAPGLIVDREVEPPRVESAAPVSRSPFGDKSSLVTRCLLEHEPSKTWDLKGLAAAAGAPISTTAGVVRWLVDEGFATAERGRTLRIELTDPIGLFMRWTHAYSWTRNERLAVSAPIAEPRQYFHDLATHLADTTWAVTMSAAGDLLGAKGVARRIHVYVDVKHTAELSALAVRAGWRPDAHGRLVLMRPFYKRSVWTGVRSIQSMPVVSDIQLALDLWHYPERGIEQAEYILSHRFPQRFA